MSVKIKLNLKSLHKVLNQLKDGSTRIGWQRISDANHALWNELGAHLKGSQPFFIDGNGEIHFLRKTSALGLKALSSTKTGARNLPKPLNLRHSKNKANKIAGLGVTKPSYIPPRPMLRITFSHNSEAWISYFQKLSKEILQGKISSLQAFHALGLRISADLKATIGNGNFKPNSYFTVKRKGRNTPLIWNGQMQDSVTYEVKIND